METELKRKYFLERLEKAYEIVNRLENFRGHRLHRKIIRFLFNPSFYLYYLLYRYNLLKSKKATLFWGKTIKVNCKKSLPFFAITGILQGRSEYKLTKFFIKNLKENDIFYDVGANYGFYTYLALEFCKEVHSFEPLPDVFENLKMNLENVENVFLNQVALSDKDGIERIYTRNDKGLDASESSTIIKLMLDLHYDNYKFPNVLLIKTITLDVYLKDHNKPTVIKLDVEGAESLIIDGGYQFFKNNSPIITIEVLPSNKGGEISMEAVEKLRRLGYKSYFINNDGDINLVKGDLSQIVDKENLFSDNFVFKK
jgi:FkbM family methyltransferase